MNVSYDPDADCLYVRFRPPERWERTEQLDDLRNIDYDVDGDLIGVEFINASGGVDLEGVPFADDIRRALIALPRPVPA